MGQGVYKVRPIRGIVYKNAPMGMLFFGRVHVVLR